MEILFDPICVDALAAQRVVQPLQDGDLGHIALLFAKLLG
jgi:hypothetical protein